MKTFTRFTRASYRHTLSDFKSRYFGMVDDFVLSDKDLGTELVARCYRFTQPRNHYAISFTLWAGEAAEVLESFGDVINRTPDKCHPDDFHAFLVQLGYEEDQEYLHQEFKAS